MRTLVVALVIVGAALAVWGTYTHIEADRAVVESAERVADACDSDDPHAMDPPIRGGLQYKITCPSVDAGVAVARLDAPDGGALSMDTLYVAPVVGSSVNVRVGFGSVADVTASTGLEVGTSGREGVGVGLDVSNSAKPECKSEGAAQQVDVIPGSK